MSTVCSWYWAGISPPKSAGSVEYRGDTWDSGVTLSNFRPFFPKVPKVRRTRDMGKPSVRQHTHLPPRRSSRRTSLCIVWVVRVLTGVCFGQSRSSRCLCVCVLPLMTSRVMLLPRLRRDSHTWQQVHTDTASSVARLSGVQFQDLGSHRILAQIIKDAWSNLQPCEDPCCDLDLMLAACAYARLQSIAWNCALCSSCGSLLCST
jgi:hypothetical protein